MTVRTRSAGFPRKSALTLAALLGVALATVPALASSEPAATVKAVETGSYSYAWSPTEASVPAGGEVAFANSTAGVPHGIVWTSRDKPSCAATVPDGEGGKETSSASSWSGSCRFTTAGTYLFRCYVHPYMTGTVTVSAPTTTTTTGMTTGTTETAPTTTTTTTPGAPAPLTEQSPLQGSASHALKLPKRQRAGHVRGSISLSPAAAGGRLEIDLLAARGLPMKSRRAAPVRVGRLVLSGLHAGETRFAVALDRRARSALRSHRRLALVVKLTVTPVAAKPLTITRSVVEHI